MKKSEKEFKKMILSDEYVHWLIQFTNKYSEFDDVYFVHNYRHLLSQDALLMIDYLKYLYNELNRYAIKRDVNYEAVFSYILSYNDERYVIENYGEGYSCRKYNSNDITLPCINYNEFKKSLEKNMQINFDFLKDRVIDSLNHSDLEFIRHELSKLDEPTIFSGVGGSSVVSEFGSKVINKKNGIISINSEPRDFIYRNNTTFKNVVACSYSGNNYGVSLSFDNNLKHYLLSNNSFDDNSVTYLKYSTTLPKENSFISLAATLIPVSVMLNYYLGDNNFTDMIKPYNFNFDVNASCYEIFSGIDTSTVSKYLESTMIEAGLGIPIVHDKYAYCHGRSTISTRYNSIAIYLYKGTEFDKMMLDELVKYYKDIVVLGTLSSDQLLDDYQMLVQAMYLTKYMSESQKIDLSGVKYNPIVKKLYKYNGKI